LDLKIKEIRASNQLKHHPDPNRQLTDRTVRRVEDPQRCIEKMPTDPTTGDWYFFFTNFADKSGLGLLWDGKKGSRFEMNWRGKNSSREVEEWSMRKMETRSALPTVAVDT
jgi:hypothetical protein